MTLQLVGSTRRLPKLIELAAALIVSELGERDAILVMLALRAGWLTDDELERLAPLAGALAYWLGDGAPAQPPSRPLRPVEAPGKPKPSAVAFKPRGVRS